MEEYSFPGVRAKEIPLSPDERFFPKRYNRGAKERPEGDFDHPIYYNMR